MSKALSVIIPTYNEGENIVPLVERIHNTLSHYDYEIFFVDDDSKDGTADTIEKLSESYPVGVAVRKKERGLASAVVHGILNTSGQKILVMDADLQHPPEVIPSLIKAVEDGADIVVASRYVEGGSCEEWGLCRKLVSAVSTTIAHIFLPPTRPVKDPMSGFFMFDRKIVENARLQPRGYKILLEILMEGKFQNVVEVPFTFVARDEGESKLNTKQQIEYLRHIYSLMCRKGEMARFIKFCLVGLSGVGVNMGLLWLLTEYAGLVYLLSAAIAVETSIITNFLLNNFITFRGRNEPGARPFFQRLLKFNLISLIGLGINIGLLSLFTEVFGIYYLVSNIIAIIIVTLWNYLLNTWWTWR